MTAFSNGDFIFGQWWPCLWELIPRIAQTQSNCETSHFALGECATLPPGPLKFDRRSNLGPSCLTGMCLHKANLNVRKWQMETSQAMMALGKLVDSDWPVAWELGIVGFSQTVCHLSSREYIYIDIYVYITCKSLEGIKENRTKSTRRYRRFCYERNHKHKNVLLFYKYGICKLIKSCCV